MAPRALNPNRRVAQRHAILLATVGLLSCSTPPASNNGKTPKTKGDGSELVGPAMLASAFVTSAVADCGDATISDGAVLRFFVVNDGGLPVNASRTPSDAIGFDGSALIQAVEPACSQDDCSFGTCSAPPGLDYDVCNESISLSAVTEGRRLTAGENERLFGVLVENSGSMEGWLPVDVGSGYPDWDQDGIGEGQQDPGVVRARASDFEGQRKAALRMMAGRAEAFLDAQSVRTSFGLWAFEGEDDVQSLIELSGNDGPWTQDVGDFENAISALPEVGGTRAGVVRALETVLDHFGTADDTEKFLVVLVDGPDDFRADAGAAITRAADLGVRVFVVQLDSPAEVTTQGGTPIFRDDPQYWAEQSPCSADDDCASFEQCVVPTGYSTVPGGSVEVGPEGISYCLVRRDESGRMGALPDYQRLACATEGGHFYVSQSQSLGVTMSPLVLALGALWEAELTVSTIAPGRALLMSRVTLDPGDSPSGFELSPDTFLSPL